MLLNLGMIAGDALVRGGTLAIGGESHGEVTEIVLKAEGTRVVLDDELRRTLVDGADGREVTPRSAAAYLIHTLVAETGGNVQVSAPAENVLLFGATIRAR